MKIDLSSFTPTPGCVVVVVAEEARIPAIADVLRRAPVPPGCEGTPVLFLQPGEKIQSLTGEELAAAGLKRI